MDSKKLSTSVLLNIKELINTKKKILLVSHYSPDGYAIGSSLGLYYFIKDVLYKDCVVYNRDGIPNYLSFLLFYDQIHLDFLCNDLNLQIYFLNFYQTNLSNNLEFFL